MRLLVLAHVVLANEAFAALGTNKRPIPGVKEAMPVKICFMVELLRAEFTLVWFVVAMLS
jgi:hypothetical protein